MKRFLTETIRTLVPLIILAAGVVGVAAMGGRKTPDTAPVASDLAPLVETRPVVAATGGLDVEVDGLVVPWAEIPLSAEVSGRITKKDPACRAGQYVTKDTLLYEIDPETYRLEVERLERELDQAQAQLDELEIEQANTQALIGLATEERALQQKLLRRTEQLAARQVATETDLDEARRAELSARNSLRTLENQQRMIQTRRARLESAYALVKARKRQVELDLEHTQIKAPVDGVIVEDLVEQGAYVQTGTQLLTIEDTSSVEVLCSLRMEELQWILRQDHGRLPAAGSSAAADYQLPPTPVTVSYTMGGHRWTWSGQLSRYDGIGLDERTRTVRCRVLVPTPREVRGEPGVVGGPRALVRGMYVRVTMHADPGVQLLQFPERTVRPSAEGTVVWVFRPSDGDADSGNANAAEAPETAAAGTTEVSSDAAGQISGRLEVVPVRIVRTVGENVIVEATRQNLTPGDQVITSPLTTSLDGMAIRREAVIQ